MMTSEIAIHGIGNTTNYLRADISSDYIDFYAVDENEGRGSERADEVSVKVRAEECERFLRAILYMMEVVARREQTDA